MKWLRTATTSVTMLLMLGGSAAAQTAGGTGVILGTVTDNTKAVLPGVTVTVSGPAAMGTPTAVTGENGAYRIPSLPPGEYSVKFELAGFGTVIREGIRVGVGFTATVNTELNVASVAESVTVSGQSPVVDVTQYQVATRFDTRAAREPAGRPRLLGGARADAGGLDGPRRCRRQRRAHAAALHRLRTGQRRRGQPRRSRRHHGQRGRPAAVAATCTTPTTAPSPRSRSTPSATAPRCRIPACSASSSPSRAATRTTATSTSITRTSRSRPPTSTTRRSRPASRGSRRRRTRATPTASRSSSDFNVDLGGFVKQDRLWWYGAIRRTDTDQRYPTLLDDIQDTRVPVGTAKATWNVTQGHKVTGFYQYQTKEQPDYLGAIRIAGGRQTRR